MKFLFRSTKALNVLFLTMSASLAFADKEPLIEMNDQTYVIEGDREAHRFYIKELNQSQIHSKSTHDSKMNCDRWSDFINEYPGRVTTLSHIDETSTVSFSVLEFLESKEEFLQKVQQQLGPKLGREAKLEGSVYVNSFEIEPVFMEGNLIAKASEESKMAFLSALERAKRSIASQLSVANATGVLKLTLPSPLIHCDLSSEKLQFRIKLEFDIRKDITRPSPLSADQITQVVESLRMSKLNKQIIQSPVTDYSAEELSILRVRELQMALSRQGKPASEINHREFLTLWSSLFSFGSQTPVVAINSSQAQTIAEKLTLSESQSKILSTGWINNKNGSH